MRIWPLRSHNMGLGAPISTAEKAYSCLHCLSGERPVLYVCREDGDLIFSCGANDHEQSPADWLVVHGHHLLDLDPGLHAVIDVADGSQAEREALGAPWTWGELTE